MNPPRIKLLSAVAVIILTSINAVGDARHQDLNADTTATISPARAKRIIARRAREVILALKHRDMARLSALVHPTKGVRFTPYNYVSIKDDRLYKRAAVRKLFSNNRKLVWGDWEGSGDPIRLSFYEYYKQFIYDQDFAKLPGVTYNTFNTRGSADNPWEYYPGAIIVGYYYPGIEGPRGGAMDWKGLRLAFQKKGSQWYLVGVLHDEWLI